MIVKGAQKQVTALDPVVGVATVSHQVRCINRGHLNLCHGSMPLLRSMWHIYYTNRIYKYVFYVIWDAHAFSLKNCCGFNIELYRFYVCWYKKCPLPRAAICRNLGICDGFGTRETIRVSCHSNPCHIEGSAHNYSICRATRFFSQSPRYHWNGVFIMPNLSSLAAPRVVVTTTCSAKSDHKVGIMTFLGFQWRWYPLQRAKTPFGHLQWTFRANKKHFATPLGIIHHPWRRHCILKTDISDALCRNFWKLYR